MRSRQTSGEVVEYVLIGRHGEIARHGTLKAAKDAASQDNRASGALKWKVRGWEDDPDKPGLLRPTWYSGSDEYEIKVVRKKI